MPLEWIEVEDFKSYKGKHLIGPFSSFSCIIGSNGGGKSNLMDAISFVLGVKSQHLRGSNIRDLIYRGRRIGLADDDEIDQTQEGEAHYYSAQKASVIASFKNSRNKQYNFERTITTSGSSEYKLNGQSVTYADYNKALINENILVKTKNFLVFQGDVEAVATQSPLALSKLIDQISGSSEHKERYEDAKSAQDKANETSIGQSLKRRTLNGEIKQYKEQKNELKKFEDLKGQKDELIMKLLLMKLYHIESEITANSDLIESKKSELQQLRSLQEDANKELKRAVKTKAESHKATIKAENTIKSQQKEINEKNPSIVSLDAKINHSKNKIKTSENNAQRLQVEVTELEERVGRYKKDVEKIEKAAERAQEEARKLTESRGIKLSEEDLNEYRTLKTQAMSLIPTIRQNLEKLSRDEKSHKSKLNTSRSRLNDYESKYEKLQMDNKRANINVDDAIRSVHSSEDDLNVAKQKYDKLLNERNKITQLETEKNEKLHSLLDQLSSASHDLRQAERDNKFKDVLVTLKRMFPGVRGKLVDLCQPTQSKYSTAVVTALGRNVESIVVDDEATAIQCIDYMKTQRVGSATFLPLDTLQIRPIQERLRTIHPGARLTIDILKLDSVYDKAIQFACGSSLVCDNLDIARNIVYDRTQDVKAVTVDGTVIHRSGLITGGQGSRDSGRRFDQAQYDMMLRRRDELVIQLKALRTRKPQPKADEELINEVKKMENALTIAKDNLEASKSRLNGLEKELKATEIDHQSALEEFRKHETSYGNLKTQLDSVLKEVHEAEDEVFSNFCSRIGIENIREYEDREGKIAEAENEARVKFETQIAKLNNLLKFEQDQLISSRSRLEKLENKLKKDNENLKLIEREHQELIAKTNEFKENIDDLEHRLEELRNVERDNATTLDSSRRNAQQSEHELDTALKEIGSCNDIIRNLASERFSIYRRCKVDELPLELVAGSLDQVPIDAEIREIEPMDIEGEEDMSQRVVQIDDYGIEVNFESIEDEDELTEEKDLQYRREIDQIALDIERMAPNLKAKDRLGDMQSKLNSTEKEFEYARKETKQARDMYNDIRSQRQELFMNAFNHISNNIDSVYKELTQSRANPTGGVAYLSLEDEDEPYNAGIKYHAMPPGKPFRDMYQLSGGEKTIAAMALLFAIQKYRPAPFFVLDEVDSALDNVNSAQIARYLRNHIKDSQYLFITHSSRVFERSDSLVGVYRNADKNTSQVLTLDLTQYDEN